MINIFISPTILVSLIFGLQFNHYTKPCFSCKNEYYTFKHEQGQESYNLTTHSLNGLTIHSLEKMIPVNQRLIGAEYIEWLAGYSKFYYVIPLRDNYFLKVIPSLANEPTFDFINMELNEYLLLVKNMKIECAFIFSNKECITNKLQFIIKDSNTLSLLIKEKTPHNNALYKGSY